MAAWTTGSSVFFVTLVVCQLGHLLSMRRKDSPYFSDVKGATAWEKVVNAVCGIRIYPRILLAWAAAMGTAVIVTEIPALQYICTTDSVPALYWGYSFAWAVALFVLAEVRKWCIWYSPKGWVARLSGF